MDVRSAYESFGGDYDGVTSRLVNDERIAKFMRIFAQDTLLDDFRTARDAMDIDAMFLATHTIKGNSQTMGFTNLLKTSSELTEALRAKDVSDLAALSKAMEDDYEAVLAAIESLDS